MKYKLNYAGKKAWCSLYLNAFFIVDPSDHLHTHLRDLVEGGLLQTDVSQDLNHPLSHTNARILQRWTHAWTLEHATYSTACRWQQSITRGIYPRWTFILRMNFNLDKKYVISAAALLFRQMRKPFDMPKRKHASIQTASNPVTVECDLTI